MCAEDRAQGSGNCTPLAGVCSEAALSRALANRALNMILKLISEERF